MYAKAIVIVLSIQTNKPAKPMLAKVSLTTVLKPLQKFYVSVIIISFTFVAQFL